MKYSRISLWLLILIIFSPAHTLASVYGGCAYGAGQYENCVTPTATATATVSPATSTTSTQTKKKAATAQTSEEASEPSPSISPIPELDGSEFSSDSELGVDTSSNKIFRYLIWLLILLIIGYLIFLLWRKRKRRHLQSHSNQIDS